MMTVGEPFNMTASKVLTPSVPLSEIVKPQFRRGGSQNQIMMVGAKGTPSTILPGLSELAPKKWFYRMMGGKQGEPESDRLSQ